MKYNKKKKKNLLITKANKIVRKFIRFYIDSTRLFDILSRHANIKNRFLIFSRVANPYLIKNFIKFRDENILLLCLVAPSGFQISLSEIL